MAVCGLVTVLVMAKIFHLDKGLAAGLAAGGMTQSAIIGTAGDAISRHLISHSQKFKDFKQMSRLAMQ